MELARVTCSTLGTLLRLPALRTPVGTRATGRLAKTDKVDARVLAEIGASLDLRPTRSVAAARQRLAELVGWRDDIVAAITANMHRQRQARDPIVRRDVGRTGEDLCNRSSYS